MNETNQSEIKMKQANSRNRKGNRKQSKTLKQTKSLNTAKRADA